MITVERISLLSYLLSFSGHRSSYADRCARAAAEKGVLLAAEQDGSPAGYICAVEETGGLLITYAYTAEELRRQGVFSEMMKVLTGIAGNRPLRLSIKAGHPFFAAFESVCGKNGFQQTEPVKTYICRSEDLERNWQAFMESRGSRLCAALEKLNFSAVSFADAPKELLGQVYFSPESDYANSLDPKPFFDVKARNMLYDMSFAAVKNGRLAAYVLTVGAGKDTAIFEHISSHKNMQMTGAVLLPFCRSIEEFFRQGMKTSSYAMYDSNSDAGAFRNKVLSVFDTRCSEVINFIRCPAGAVKEETSV